MVKEQQIEYRLNTMVMDISQDKVITAMSRQEGMYQIRAKAVILAMGCRERPRGALTFRDIDRQAFIQQEQHSAL